VTGRPIGCPDCGTPIDRQCTGHTTRDRGDRLAGHRCHNSAVRGALVCGFHGAAAPQVKAAAQRRLAEDAARKVAAKFVVPVRTTAREALTEELWRVTALVDWLDEKCAELRDKGELTWYLASRTLRVNDQSGSRSTEGVMVTRLHPVAEWYERERHYLAKLTLDMERIGIDARQVKLAEEYAEFLRQVLDAALMESGLTLAQQAMVNAAMPGAIRRLAAVPDA
jgi:hypothetical protein